MVAHIGLPTLVCICMYVMQRTHKNVSEFTDVYVPVKVEPQVKRKLYLS
jgi:hypothetical protein